MGRAKKSVEVEAQVIARGRASLGFTVARILSVRGIPVELQPRSAKKSAALGVP